MNVLNKAGFYGKDDRPMHCAPSIHIFYCPLALVIRPIICQLFLAIHCKAAVGCLNRENVVYSS